MKNRPAWYVFLGIVLVALVVFVSGVLGGETPDTVALRKILDTEAIGWERGDVKLLLDLYAARFVGYAGYTIADSVRWQVSFGDFDELADFAEAELLPAEGRKAAVKYAVMRRDTYFDVLADKAVAVTEDSVRVTSRATGETRVFSGPVFWMFAKEGDDWVITGFVGRWFPTRTAGGELPSPAVEGVSDVFEADAEAWTKGDIGGLLARYSDERFVGYSGGGVSNLAAWKVFFQDKEEFGAFLKKRLFRTSYKLSRRVIHSHTKGSEAVVVTKDLVSTTHKETRLSRSLERYTLWTLSRLGGKWQITSFYLDVALPQAG